MSIFRVFLGIGLPIGFLVTLVKAARHAILGGGHPDTPPLQISEKLAGLIRRIKVEAYIRLYIFRSWLSQHKTRLVIIGFILLLFLILFLSTYVRAQAITAIADSFTCPATGSSAEFLAARDDRVSWALLNTSAGGVRVGYISSGLPALNDANSVLIPAGTVLTDDFPSTFRGRIVCASNDATARVVGRIEGRRT